MDYLKTRAPFWKKEESARGDGWVAAKRRRRGGGARRKDRRPRNKGPGHCANRKGDNT